ncbi:MAG TPA: 2-phosphosulfolactate phosphatase [Candidatus Limnocylindria bacterium]|nr:2-phosphosulfolactate phosphatase [Candidatus Limnocylindria bacterium]
MQVQIDCFYEHLEDYPAGTAVVAVDVIRSSTTAVTAVAEGRRCFVVPDLDAAARQRASLGSPFMVGELGGNMPFGFDATNSPVAISQLGHLERPIVLLSSSGTRLMSVASAAVEVAYVACLRNWRAAAAAILRRAPDRVVLLGAGTRGEFREEDQLCSAWIAAALLAGGASTDAETQRLIDRWEGAPVTRIGEAKSGAYLRASGQLHDLEYLISHVDDVDASFVMRGDEVCNERPTATSIPTGA